jgi:hypothetical protein
VELGRNNILWIKYTVYGSLEGFTLKIKSIAFASSFVIISLLARQVQQKLM